MDKHYHFQEWEPKILAWWDKAQHSPQAQGQPYTIIMPPPNVTGSLHLGHALSSTFQDILIRYHRMRGYQVLWLPGTDHAGIATQMMVEKEVESQGLTRQGLGRTAFVERIWAWKEKYGSIIIDQMKRLGFSAQWDHLCFTLDPAMNQAVNHAFVTLHQKGLIYRAERLVNWDCKLKTALSDLEVINKTESGVLWTLFYPLPGNEQEGIKVATTRPETLFGDVAVAVHPEDVRYAHLIGQSVRIPLTQRLIPIIADEGVDIVKGTGAVKITPGHDFFDFEIAKRHHLPMRSILSEGGVLNDRVPFEFVGLGLKDAREKVLSQLAEHLVQEEVITHTVPYSERSSTLVEPRLTEQWFIDMKGMAEKAIQAVEQGETTFHPHEWANNYFEWLKTIQPWCVSRQLWWGHQIPVWYGPENSVFVAHNADEAQAQAKARFGTDVELRQDEDVLDTWFSSGLWPFSTLGWPENTKTLDTFYPTNVLVTGFDIIFFWVARMMMLGLEMTGKVPFKDVYIHPLIRDEKGQKMSKTKKNAINPLEIIEEYGADALRFALSSAACGKQYMRFSLKNVEQAQHFMTKIWNSVRFLSLKGVMSQDTKKAIEVRPSGLRDPVNQWFVWQLSQSVRSVSTHLDQFRFHEAALDVHHLVWHVFCDWFIEFSKENLGCAKTRDETSHVALWGLGVIVRLMHPFLPFLSEKIGHDLTGEGGHIAHATWPKFECEEPEHAKAVEWIMDVVSAVRRIRSQFSLPFTTLLDLHVYGADSTHHHVVEAYTSCIEKWLGLKTITMNPPDGGEHISGVTIPVHRTTLVLPLAHLIDIGSEIKRLEECLSKVCGEIDKLHSRMDDPHFRAKAPEDVVEDIAQRLEEHQGLKQMYSDALAAMKKPH